MNFPNESRKGSVISARSIRNGGYRIVLGVLGSELLSHFGRVLQLGENVSRVHQSHDSFVHSQCDETLPLVILTFRSR